MRRVCSLMGWILVCLVIHVAYGRKFPVSRGSLVASKTFACINFREINKLIFVRFRTFSTFFVKILHKLPKSTFSQDVRKIHFHGYKLSRKFANSRKFLPSALSTFKVDKYDSSKNPLIQMSYSVPMPEKTA